jgi:mannose-6-phosphate isomerase-like protein (cupin superfamily)
MSHELINLKEKLDLFTDLWSPRIVARANGQDLKLVKLKGDFVWHRHADTDEVFMVLSGSMRIDFRDGWVELKAGEICVVPMGVEHRPSAEEECHILLLEGAGTRNTGDAGGERTSEDDVWI